MVENSTVGVAYSYYTVYNIDDIALCASRTEFLTQGVHPSLQREGYKNATAYIPVKGHYGRSYTADRW